MTARQWRQLVLVGLGAAGVPLDTAVNIAFPDITHSFGLPIQMIQWVVIAYVLTYASLMLAFGRVGDMFGHGRVFRIGLLWSTVAFLLCALAPAYDWLLFCRFLQGIGAGLVISVAPALVTDIYPEHGRSRAVAAFTLMFAIASGLGPLLGGALVRYWGWPAVFWFRAPIAFLALLFLGELPARVRPQTREPLDIAGAALLALGISTVLLTVNQAQRLGRHDWLALPLAAAAILSLWGFVRRERGIAEPIVNLEFFRIPGFALVNLASILFYLSNFSVLLFGPYYLVRFTGLSLPAAGALLATSFAGMMAASPVAGRVIERVAAHYAALFGALLTGAGLVLIGTWDPAMPRPTLHILAALLLQGIGLGFFQVAYLDVVMASLPQHNRGIAGSLAMLTRTLGTVGGATVLTLLFHAVEAGALAQGAGAGFLAAYRTSFRVAGALAGLGGLLAAAAAWRRR